MRKLAAPPLPAWLDAMLPFERTLVALRDDTKLHVMETGPKDGRPVLLLHGNPTWGFLWRKVAAALAATSAPLRLVMPDLYGLGLSDKPRAAAAHTLDHHAAIIGELIDELRLDRLIFVGQDWGGPIGLRALADRKDRLGGLVILNTVVGPPRPGFRATGFHRFARLPIVSDVAFRLLGLPQRALWVAQGDRRSLRGGDVARAYRWPLRGLANNLAPLALARMVPDSFEHPSIAPLRRCQEVVETFTGPSAIVWGDRDPVLGSVRSWIEKLMPRARVTRTQAGHFLQEQVPREIADAIRFVHA